MKIRSTKLEKLQITSNKLQTNHKPQITNYKYGFKKFLEGIVILDIVIWNSFGIWDLGFGIS
jgi:hypothetical protein